MIDGILILRLAVIINDLLNNDLLLFPLPIDKNGGEILDKTRTSEHRGLLFIIKNNNVKLKGSLHKYHNNGLHNYNDYFFTDLQQTIFELSEKFNLNPDRSLLNNLEFGVNIQTKYNSAEVFRSIVNYKGTPFNKFSITGAKGIECETDNFYIKIYDKGHQYNQPGNLLRFEIKVRKMKFFKDRDININSLATLLDYSEIYKLKRVLLTVFNEILFTDYNINPGKLTPANRLILSQGSNPKHWEQLKPDSNDFKGKNKNKEYISKRKKYYRALDNFKKLVCKYSTSTIQKDISFLIENKCNELLKFDCKTVDKFPDLKTPQKITDSGQIHISNIVGYCPTTAKDTRVCLTCGNDISHKRKIAKFCCKKCKNDYTNPKLNPKNSLLRRIDKRKKDSTLFDVSEFIVLSEQQRELLNNINSIRNYERI
jgi:hypothetical protein